MRIVIYGVGRRFERVFELLHQFEIVALVDKDERKWNTEYKGYAVISPEDITKMRYDYLIVTPATGFLEISSALIFTYGIRAQTILSLDYFIGINEEDYLEDTRSILRFLLGNQYVANSPACFSQAGFDDVKPEQFNNLVNYRGTLLKYSVKSDGAFYTVFHKPYRMIDAPEYRSIAVGKNKDQLMCSYQDDNGDHISEYNEFINEATALYWIWKNDVSSVVGFNHYRRYFESPFCKGWPLQIWEAEIVLQQYDVIVADHVWYKNETVLQAMRSHVCSEALEGSYNELRCLFKKKYPDYLSPFDKMTNGRMIYPCEMFVMRRELMEEYCEWLFPIVFDMLETIKVKDTWDEYSKRIIGFWTERLLTVWLMVTDYSVYELPVVLLDNN